jgi:hypothetical protein
MCCRDCGEKYEIEDLRFGLCEDCLDDFQNRELEDQIDDLINDIE